MNNKNEFIEDLEEVLLGWVGDFVAREIGEVSRNRRQVSSCDAG
jgi:hypothetical protein